ncbi:MarR family winged helix-turn-helix transcriptional regulator [Pseudovibrio brasiliensis]|uniref:MarR family transcriptional regulator n=1 Tax=Pseudovibrio brasiliensis TaxID=1898042 RepID=A0ABX8ALR1_9HYPH|nr:MarR family transcriptional regulator [Pseudovibrio brasiliensis]QUS54161.1 MarR family transcriptional regulator [Pseudovibrio brasiliensis]
MSVSKESVSLWIALNRVQKTIYTEIESAFKAERFPPLSWYDILWELENAPDGLRQFELEERVLFQQANLSRVIQSLAKAGLVESKPAPKDKRGKTLYITGKGKDLRAQMWQTYERMLEEKLDTKVSPDNATQLAEALRTLL